jgi:hypothetical protein
MTSKYISIFSATAVGVLSAVAVLGGLASVSSAASGGPTVVLTSTSASSTASSPIPITATFSEAVNGLMSANITATNASVGTVSGSGTTYTFTLTPTATGTVTVMIAANMASSTASSTGSQVSNTLTFMYDPSMGTTTGTTTAFLALSTYSGPPGTIVSAIGTNFATSEQVSLTIAGMSTTTVTADTSGNFTSPFTVGMMPVGPMSITATGQTSGRVAVNSFYVQDATSTPSASSTPLSLDSIETVRSNATADGTFANGWEWILRLTVPDNETHFAMKFNDFTSSSSSSTIPAMNNIRIWTMQSSNASTTASSMVEAGNGYSGDMMLNSDMSSTTAGRQIEVHVQVAVPLGTGTGSYSTLFGAMSTTTAF